MKIVFIILNYNTFQETKDCVLSIESKIDTQNYKIVIVDNLSTDDSADKIEKFIEQKNNMILIRNTENLGFAKGNNVGIEYAKRNYKPQFIVALNSDTELIQNDLVEKLDNEYRNSEFALLGPLILTADGRCDNSPHYPPTVEHIQKELRTFFTEEKIIKRGLYRPYCGIRFLRNLVRYKILKKDTPLHRNMEFYQYQRQVVLQGCFLVFSEKAFEYIKGFDERTFLYYEEPVKNLSLMKHDLVTVFDPEIVIYHKEGRSTSSVAKKNKDKLLFINKCYQQSAIILLNILKEANKEER
ncbi:N-glycosyltransferase [Blautia luti]|uniref:N-glycosyltransferase n=1 Tax=Blautia luti TaxID=89014 RepID=A0A564W3C9_9FIRM|nr:glycosyltransferase family 2 protein [Blautia luti]VUX39451.1 N-glycosyltransferase [Blautia luti]